ncbi:MAG: MFS transporter [Dehalococcoidia bacterium]
MALAPAALWDGRTELTTSFLHREFRALWSASALSAIAQWTLLTARSALAFQLTGGSGSVGVVVFAAMLPFVFVPPIGGVLADRFNRRTVATCTLALSLLTAVLMAALTITGLVQVWHLFVLSLLNGTARSIEMPSTQAMAPALVAKDRLVNAVALMGVTTHGSRLVGPLITLVVLGTLGAGGTFMVAGLLYAIGILLMQRVPRPAQSAQAARENPLWQLWDGARYSATEPAVGVILLLVFFHCGLTMSYDALMPKYAAEHLGSGGGPFSTLMIAVGAGALIGPLMLPGVSQRWPRARLLLGGAVNSGLAPALLALSPGWIGAAPAAVLMGGSQGLFMALTNAFVQTAAPTATAAAC